MRQIEILIDHKMEIEFWTKLLDNPNIDEDNKKLLNRGLYFTLKTFLYPVDNGILCDPKDAARRAIE